MAGGNINGGILNTRVGKKVTVNTAIIKAKLAQELASIAEVAFHTVFLDLRKAYDSIDRERTPKILEAYGVGKNLLALIKAFWDAASTATPSIQDGLFSPLLFNVLRLENGLGEAIVNSSTTIPVV